MKYLATDLDRTLLPNGPDPVTPCMDVLQEIIKREHIIPLFITARRAESVIHRVILRYKTPEPYVIIGAVGGEIYIKTDQGFEIDTEWNKRISRAMELWDAKAVEDALQNVPGTEIQPDKEQLPHKRSYYINHLDIYDKTLAAVQKKLAPLQKDFSFKITHSKDLNSHIGYIDVTPPAISKKEALFFIMKKYDISEKDIVFAGDSGNDMDIIESSLDTIMVGNAEEELKDRAQKNKSRGKLIIARGIGAYNGNYTAGIIEGLHKLDWLSHDIESYNLK
ncbi:MAG: HAD-IIB family hydrolase [Fibrobacterota bacterium]